MKLKVQPDNKEMMKNLIEEMEDKKLDVINGWTEKDDLVMIQLVEGHERHKLKTTVMQDDGVNHITYFGAYGEYIEDFYENEELPD